MSKQAGYGVPLPFIKLRRGAESPLYLQLVLQLRKMILTGNLKARQRLPATRVLMRELNVSRSTVIAAFEQLVSEGYFVSKVGAGTFVENNLQLPKESEDAADLSLPKIEKEKSVTLSNRGRQLVSNLSLFDLRPTPPRPFAPNVPAVDLFPHKTWSRLENKIRNSTRGTLMNYGDPGGYFPLRIAVADYVYSHRGIKCDPKQVIVTTATQKSLHLIASLLIDPGDKVLIEDPASYITQQAFRSQGAVLCPLSVDDNGIDVNMLDAENRSAKMVYMTPSCQYPLGVTMPVARRLDWLAWANQNSAWIVEDDEDCEFRFLKRAMPALASLDQNGRVIYNWSFSKVLFPSLRLGVLIVPPELVETFEIANGIVDRGPNSWSQAVLCEFIQEGYLASHIRRMTCAYAARREILLDALRKKASGLLEPVPTESGLRIIAKLPSGISDQQAESALRNAGIIGFALSGYCQDRQDLNGLLLGYSSTSEEQIPAAVDKLIQALQPIVENSQYSYVGLSDTSDPHVTPR